MKIECSKTISKMSLLVIAKVDFFEKEKSPYINLLKDINSQKDLEEKLEDSNISEIAIKNIIKRLYDLKVIVNNRIDIKNGFPEREFGKYKISYYCNMDKKKPFSIYYNSIERIEPITKYCYEDNIEKLECDLLSKLNTNNKKIKILEIINNKGILTKEEDSILLKITYDDNLGEWKYLINDEEIDWPVEQIPFEYILGTRWNGSYYEENFDDIKKDDENALVNFVRNYEIKDKNINCEYGEYNIKLENVPIIPNERSKNKWFMYLLKKELQSRNNYFTKEDIEQIWNNIFDTLPQSNIWLNMDYEYEKVLKQFDKKEEIYWLIRSLEDLNPFENYESTTNEDGKIVISGVTNGNLSLNSAFNCLNLNNAKSIIILDRYINSKKNFAALFKIKKSFPNLYITIYSQDFDKILREDEKLEIKKDLKKYNIERHVKEKKNIPHNRYWKIDDIVYNVSSSIDFIHELKHTFFYKVDSSDIEIEAINYLK